MIGVANRNVILGAEDLKQRAQVRDTNRDIGKIAEILVPQFAEITRSWLQEMQKQ